MVPKILLIWLSWGKVMLMRLKRALQTTRDNVATSSWGAHGSHQEHVLHEMQEVRNRE